MPGAVVSGLVSSGLALAVLAPLLGEGWRVVALPNQTFPLTRYSAERIDGRDAMRIDARASYGNLVHALPNLSAPRYLRWSWRLQQANAQADLRRKAGDDSPAKVCLSFDVPLQQVPFVERQLLRVARAQSNQDLPAATLCWVWDAREAVGTLLPNPYTRRVRYIVLRGAGDATGAWFDEQRNVAADFQRAFGDEINELPALTAVIVAGDADNTGASSTAHIAALRFEP
jgi:hypothetical protein